MNLLESKAFAPTSPVPARQDFFTHLPPAASQFCYYSRHSKWTQPLGGQYRSTEHFPSPIQSHVLPCAQQIQFEINTAVYADHFMVCLLVDYVMLLGRVGFNQLEELLFQKAECICQQEVFINTTNIVGYASTDGYEQLPASSVHAQSWTGPKTVPVQNPYQLHQHNIGSKSLLDKSNLKNGSVSVLERRFICCKVFNKCAINFPCSNCTQQQNPESDHDFLFYNLTLSTDKGMIYMGTGRVITHTKEHSMLTYTYQM